MTTHARIFIGALHWLPVNVFSCTTVSRTFFWLFIALYYNNFWRYCVIISDEILVYYAKTNRIGHLLYVVDIEVICWNSSKHLYHTVISLVFRRATSSHWSYVCFKRRRYGPCSNQYRRSCMQRFNSIFLFSMVCIYLQWSMCKLHTVLVGPLQILLFYASTLFAYIMLLCYLFMLLPIVWYVLVKLSPKKNVSKSSNPL